MRSSWTLRTNSAKASTCFFFAPAALALRQEGKAFARNQGCSYSKQWVLHGSHEVELKPQLVQIAHEQISKRGFCNEGCRGKEAFKEPFFQVTAGMSCLASLRSVSLSEALVNPQRVVAIPEKLDTYYLQHELNLETL